MKYWNFVKDNKRFVSAITANGVALLLALYWLIDANILTDNQKIDLEPIVTSIALFATLLGLNYVNDKLTRPDIRFHISMVFAKLAKDEQLNGISIEIMNHSIRKVFIGSFSIKLKDQDNIITLVKNGFTRDILGRPTLEPGQSLTIILDKETVEQLKLTIENTGDFIVRDQVGRSYITPAGVLASHIGTLLQNKI
jgi:hypothetical protein